MRYGFIGYWTQNLWMGCLRGSCCSSNEGATARITRTDLQEMFLNMILQRQA
uniref:Uncharacterized protein n=1 Tax=Candidatus Kentrum sp. DK TaxID=2126562 RepID=A0A450TQP5_9GAMM|nr:MAG: hypothetical protein BECKDK2373C_GA0170839_112313 [Candidatus Kentron sp. DK]VFJ70398.1 MAG: hypothetical protein BECKDK2373B_GA0170837_12814 [Candidatus Kentron sp. DK]